MVEIIDPKKTEVILDPACGTAGFLISAYKHILKQNSTGVANGSGTSTEGDAAEQALESPMRYPGDLLQPDDRTRLARNVKGYDISPDMVRLSLVSLYLHGFADPKVEEYDTLKGSQLAQVKAELGAWLQAARAGGGEGLVRSLGSSVERSRLAEGGDYNLSAERYAATTTRTSHWPMAKLGEVVRARSGNGKVIKGTLSTEPNDGLFPAYSATGQDVFSPEYDLDENGIVVSAVGARCGKCFLATGKWQAIANTHVIIADETKTLTEYLFLFLNDESFWVKGGSAQPFVKVNASLEIEIPLPPLEVQREIVAEVEGYQRVIDGARAVLDNYRPHIPVDPEWQMVELGDVCDLYQPKTITSSDLKADGEFVVYGANGIIGRYDQFNHEHPEVLITCRGATCGTINMSQPKSWVTGNAMVATPKDDRIDKAFLHALLLGSDLSSTISGSAQPQITRQGLSPFSIPLPPVEVQQAIAAEIQAEQALVNGNRDLIARFEKKIDAAIARVWGEAKAEGGA